MTHKWVYPFVAVVGQQDVKQVLLLNAVNPHIGGVLIAGEKGTAKSTLVRGLTGILPDMGVVELPLNATEDRVVGSLDFEHALKYGVRRADPGILAKADGQILYIDEVNLLSDNIINVVLDAAASGMVALEREGISRVYQANFILVGTMNPEEGNLSPQFLDRFGLYVQVGGEKDCQKRVKVIKRRLAYEQNPVGFCENYGMESAALQQQILAARCLLPQIQPDDATLTLAAEVAKEANCAGHRADIVLIETARALAAFAARTEITQDDIVTAAKYALPHRMREQNREMQAERSQSNDETNDEQQPAEEPQNEQDSSPDNQQHPPEQSNAANEPQESNAAEQEDTDSQDDTDSQQNNEASGANDNEQVEQPGETFKVQQFLPSAKDRRTRKGAGKRSLSRVSSQRGRYVKVMLPRHKVTDIALDATLRAAVPYQQGRKKAAGAGKSAIIIKQSDLRQKVRERRVGTTILFVVDASGSMGAQQRMKAVKGAILSLLMDAYQKRDKVGLIVFRRQSAEVLLNITRSVELAQKKLRDMPTGGKTPLAGGLYKGVEVLHAAKCKDPDIAPILVLVSDGRANQMLQGTDAVEEAMSAARKVKEAGIPAMVVDTENGFVRFGLAQEIADLMDAKYYKLDGLRAETIAGMVRNME